MSPVSRAVDHDVVPGNFNGEVNFGLAPVTAVLVAFGLSVGLVGLAVFFFGIN
jgi:hypothetical protein